MNSKSPSDTRGLPPVCFPPDQRIGAHCSTRGGLITAFERGRAIGVTAMAIFSKNSNQWKAKPISDEERLAFVTARREFAKPLLVHASYLINLATTDAEIHRKSIDAMIVELERADLLGADAVVLHPGAHLGAGVEAALDQIARSFDTVHAAIPHVRAKTLLETAAGQGSCVGCTFEELGTIRKLVDDPSRLAICVDTCHIFSAGYEIRTADGYERTMDDLARHVGIETVEAFHLNDSKKGLGSRVDRHQHIGEGEIGLAAFERLLNDRRFTHVPKVIETPKPEENVSDIRNLSTLRSLLREEKRTPRRTNRRTSPSVDSSL